MDTEKLIRKMRDLQDSDLLSGLASEKWERHPDKHTIEDPYSGDIICENVVPDNADLIVHTSELFKTVYIFVSEFRPEMVLGLTPGERRNLAKIIDILSKMVTVKYPEEEE